jgi:1,4-alpha-glucan branching enzyme
MKSMHPLLSINLFAMALVLIASVLGCTGHLYPLHDPNMHQVVFSFEGQARSICIVGDFNQWAPDANCLKKHDDQWDIRLWLPRGPNHYAFVLDGERWVPDPKALYVENDGFGRQNSVVLVE